MRKTKPSTAKKYHIAFSIHGTNTFIVATIMLTDSYLGIMRQHGIRVTTSRRIDISPNDSIKLHWDGLLSAKGEPLRSAPHVLAKFNLLEKDGWSIIGRDEFISRHWNKKSVK